LKRTGLILHWNAVVQKSSLPGDGNMLSCNEKHTAREVDAFNIAQHSQFGAVCSFKLRCGNFRARRCNCGAYCCNRANSDRAGYP
jgi:hypothetical protein